MEDDAKEAKPGETPAGASSPKPSQGAGAVVELAPACLPACLSVPVPTGREGGRKSVSVHEQAVERLGSIHTDALLQDCSGWIL